MSLPSTPRATGSPPSDGSGSKILLRVPDMRVAPTPVPARLETADSRTRGMVVLQRVLARRAGIFARFSGPQRWQYRLWLAALSLIAVSCGMLAYGMRTPEQLTAHRPHHEPLLADELEESLDAETEAAAPTQHAVHHENKEPDRPTAAVSIQPAGYETQSRPTPRGVWFAGTIIPDDAADHSIQTGP